MERAKGISWYLSDQIFACRGNFFFRFAIFVYQVQVTDEEKVLQPQFSVDNPKNYSRMRVLLLIRSSSSKDHLIVYFLIDNP